MKLMAKAEGQALEPTGSQHKLPFVKRLVIAVVLMGCRNDECEERWKKEDAREEDAREAQDAREAKHNASRPQGLAQPRSSADFHFSRQHSRSFAAPR